MMMFDGKVSRKVTEEDRSTKGRKDAVEKAKQARAERETLRLQEKAVRRLQAFVRGYFTRRKLKLEQRAIFDARIHDLLVLDQMLSAGLVPPLSVLCTLVQQLNFFCVPADIEDATRLLQPLPFIVRSMSSADHKSNMLVDATNHCVSLFRIRRLGSLLIRILPAALSSQQLQDVISSLTVIMNCFTECLHRSCAQGGTQSSAVAAIFRSIEEYISLGFFGSLHKLIHNEILKHPRTVDAFLKQLIHLTVAPLSLVSTLPVASATRSKYIRGLIEAIMSVPSIAKPFLMDRIPLFEPLSIWKDISQVFIEQVGNGCLSIEERGRRSYIMGNTVQLLNAELLHELSCEDLNPVVRMIAEGLPDIPRSLLDSGDLSDEFEPDLRRQLAVLCSSRFGVSLFMKGLEPVQSFLQRSAASVSASVAVQTVVRDFVQIEPKPLAKRASFWSKLFRFASFASETPAAPPTVPIVTERFPSAVMPDTAAMHRVVSTVCQEFVFNCCRLYASLFFHLPVKGSKTSQVALNLLNSFAFHTPLVASLWAFLSTVIDLKTVAKTKHPVQTFRPFCAGLSLFCLLYSHLLLILEEDEFRKGHPFSMEQLRYMIHFLNSLLFQMYWKDDPGSQSDPLSKSLRENGSKLLRLLYDRQCVTAFAPAESWIMSGIDLRTVHKELAVSDENKDNRSRALLRDLPHVIPFEERALIFQRSCAADKERWKYVPPVTVAIRRDFVFEDGFVQLNNLQERLKGPLKVQFVDASGVVELGIDAGGLFKEFWTLLSLSTFNPDYGLFQQTSAKLLYPSPVSEVFHGSQHLKFFEFMGRIVGKALYEQITIEPTFARFFLSKMLGKFISVQDLHSLDPELYQNLMYLKTYEGNVEDLCLTFSINHEHRADEVVELIPGGANSVVNRDNRLKYIYYVAHHRLNVEIQQQTEAFIRGLNDLVPRNWLRMFNETELQLLISGIAKPFDVEDLRKHTVYTGGYSASDSVIKRFWKAVSSFAPEQRSELIRFVTSCSRPPLLGFRALHPPFCIHRAPGDDNRLPTASTCFNVLKLPQYSSEKAMTKNLLTAIMSNSGFHLE